MRRVRLCLQAAVLTIRDRCLVSRKMRGYMVILIVVVSCGINLGLYMLICAILGFKKVDYGGLAIFRARRLKWEL